MPSANKPDRHGFNDSGGLDPTYTRDPRVAAGFPGTVIASEAKQSILPLNERVDCFVASLLAMTLGSNPYSRGTKCPRCA